MIKRGGVVFPAHAGMNRRSPMTVPEILSVPRACGDEPDLWSIVF